MERDFHSHVELASTSFVLVFGRHFTYGDDTGKHNHKYPLTEHIHLFLKAYSVCKRSDWFIVLDQQQYTALVLINKVLIRFKLRFKIQGFVSRGQCYFPDD
jgi:hypothetical protein